jgi:hypothetical protein
MTKRRHHPLTIIGWAGLAWNLIGLLALAGTVLTRDESRYTMTAAQRALDDLTPNWVLMGTIVAVACGIAGSIGLLRRKNWAILMFIISLVGVAGQDIGIGIAVWFAGTLPVAFTLIMQSLVLFAAVALLLLALAARQAHELH